MAQPSTSSVISYRATQSRGVVQSIDFSTVAGKNYSFLQFSREADVEKIRSVMMQPPLNQEWVATTHVHGKPILIMRNQTSPFVILDVLKTRGESFELATEAKGFDAWKVRSYLGFAGQSLQLISSFLRPDRRIDSSVFVFAASNLAANAINLAYESEKIDDTHQLRYLKQRVNRELSPHLVPGNTVISIDDQREKKRADAPVAKPMEEAKSFLRRHSVQIGELGLRYLGAIGLAFPARHWKSAWREKKIPPMDTARPPLRAYAGLSSIFGKTVALSSKIPDPYNPKPASMLDEWREKFAFLTGGWIEVTSFSALAWDCFFNTKSNRGILINGKQHRDWLGGIGASLFVMGYIVRSFAKFGEREVNMKELYAHASDMLAQTPADKIPQLLANTSASLAEHFEEKGNTRFSTIYTNLIGDLAKYHAAVIRPLNLSLVDEKSPENDKKQTANVIALPVKPGRTVTSVQSEPLQMTPKITAQKR